MTVDQALTHIQDLAWTDHDMVARIEIMWDDEADRIALVYSTENVAGMIESDWCDSMSAALVQLGMEAAQINGAGD